MTDSRAPAPLPPPPLLPAHAALFLDLDGTLLDFASRPQDVVVEARVRETIARLHAALDGALAIVSGRPLAEIDRLSHLPSIAAAGLHGAQVRDAAGTIHAMPLAGGALDRVRQHAREHSAALDGVLLEDKGDAIAVHYRQAPHAAEAVARLCSELLRIAGSAFALQHGNHVIELRARGSDKGTAVATLMASPPFSGRQAWMIGDDLTDEHAFAVVNTCHGVSVVVGTRRPTQAKHALAGPAGVRDWLSVSAGSLE